MYRRENGRGWCLASASLSEVPALTLRQDGWARAVDGVTTLDEVLRVTQEDA